MVGAYPSAARVRELGHVPALDGLRGIAILLVLAVHTRTLLPGGRLGVDLFFVLSGFLITVLLVQEWGRGGSISLRAFYRRRMLRLAPAMAVLLAFYAVVFGLIRDDDGWQKSVTYGALYVYNAAWSWFGHDGLGANHLWSLAAEEQFYLVWPLTLMLLLARAVSPKAIIAALLVLALAVATWRGIIAQSVHSGPRMYGPDVHSDPLILGCVAGLLYGFGIARRVPLAVASVWVVIGAVIVMRVATATEQYHAYLVPIFAVSVAMVLLACTLHGEWWFARLASIAPLRWFGRISYGLYLWHFPLYALLGWKLGAPAAIVVAALSYRYVELPFLRQRHRVPEDHRDRRIELETVPVAAAR